MKLIFDNIHGYIELSQLAMQFIDTSEFQRLRNIHQTGALSYVFPTAVHKRFEHSIGTYHLTYFREPVDIVPFTGDGSTSAQVNCELGFTIHHELVELAVRIASGITNPNEYQVKLNEERINN